MKVPTLPALIDRQGEVAAWRFSRILHLIVRNENTCAAYGRGGRRLRALSRDAKCLHLEIRSP